MQRPPEPPEPYKEFIQRYPKLAQAWTLIGQAGEAGPIDPKTVRLVKQQGVEPDAGAQCQACKRAANKPFR